MRVTFSFRVGENAKKFSKILQKIFKKWSNFFDLDTSLCQCLLSALLIVFQFSDSEIRQLFSIYKKKEQLHIFFKKYSSTK